MTTWTTIPLANIASGNKDYSILNPLASAMLARAVVVYVVFIKKIIVDIDF